MIRRLEEKDRVTLVSLLSAAPHLNLYTLGNLEALGFDADFCEFIGEVVDGRVRSVANRYMTGWTVFGEADADWEALGAAVDAHTTIAERLQDNPGGVASFLPFLQRYEAHSISEEALMELDVKRFQALPAPAGFEIRKATMADLDTLVALFADAGDMSRTPPAVERPLRYRRVWLALAGGKAVSAALTNAETTSMAMIGGVYTAPEWRNRGLSQAVCSGLCQELIELGRQPALYWDNAAAGHVYTKLGFRQIGSWRSVRLNVRPSS
jgi:GNAT superfamily N-acetyltransferase